MFRKPDVAQNIQVAITALLQQLQHEFPDLNLHVAMQQARQAEISGQALAEALKIHIQKILVRVETEKHQLSKDLKRCEAELAVVSENGKKMEQKIEKLTREINEAQAEICDLKATVYRQRIQLARQHEQLSDLMGTNTNT